MTGRNILLALALGVALVSSAGARVIHVPDSAATIQGGIALAGPGDTVLVAPGTYLERVALTGTGITLASRFVLAGDSAAIGGTVIDAQSLGSVVTCTDDGGGTDLVVGFTLRNGYDSNGGGVFCVGGSPVIRSNIIEDNSTSADGAGVFVSDSASPAIIGNVIRRNRSAVWGGGIYVYNGSSPVIERNIIYDNGVMDRTPGRPGPAGPALVGGRFFPEAGPVPVFTTRGGGILVTNFGNLPMSPVVLNNTIDRNGAGQYGGGIYVNQAQVNVTNNIITGNSPHGVHADGPELVISYNDAWGNDRNISGSAREGAGSISSDPRFVDPAARDYRLRADSPCIDAGDPASPPDPDSTRADMGALYYHQAGGTAEPGAGPGILPAARAATVVRGVLNLTGLGHNPDSPGGIGLCPAHLLDASGRKVLDLVPGDNDVSRLSPGVYFVRAAPGVMRFVIAR